MKRILLIVCTLPTIFSIIVKDHPDIEYKYSYDIEDPTTGDSKSQQEIRRGDVVSGSYSVLDPDGTKRTVQYTADSKNGFNAVVHTEPAHKGMVKENYVPEKSYAIETVIDKFVPLQRLYTSVISPDASAPYYTKSQQNIMPYYTGDEQHKEMKHLTNYFTPIQGRESALSAIPRNYFEPVVINW